MKNEDLIKKLENTSLPEIEISSHKQKLKMALLDSKYFQKSNFWEIFKKSLAFAVPALVLLIVIGVSIIQPRLTEARALDIAKNDPEVQKLMAEEKVVLDEVKVKDGKAYILLNPIKIGAPRIITSEEKAIAIQEAEQEMRPTIGAVVEIDIKKGKVEKIKPVEEDISPLAKWEREKAEEIVQKEGIIQEVLSEEAKIGEVKATFPEKLRLIERGDEVLAAPDPSSVKKAEVYYTTDGEEWMVQVNLDEDRVESIIRLKGRDSESE